MYIECHNLSYHYPGTQTYVFKDLNCRISGPGFHALFGPSGVGKTTLAKIMAGELPTPSPAMVSQHTDKTLFSYNLERLPGWYSVRDHLSEVIPPSQKNLLEELIGFFGLERCLTARFASLSLGQQNRVNLIRYLMQRFGFLIMDESLANVDEATREQIILKIKEIFPDRAFIYISHNVQEVAKLCDQIWVLRGGGRDPRMVSVNGRDYFGGPLDKRAHEKTMLEVVHAS